MRKPIVTWRNGDIFKSEFVRWKIDPLDHREDDGSILEVLNDDLIDYAKEELIIDIVKLSGSKYLNVRYKNRPAFNLVSRIIYYGYNSVIQELLKKKLLDPTETVRTENKDLGEIPVVIWACSAGQFEIAKTLIKSGALNIDDKKDLINRIVVLAIKHGDLDFLEFLAKSEKSSDFNKYLNLFGVENLESLTKTNLFKNSEAALKIACLYGSSKLLKILLDQGINPRVSSSVEWSLVYYADANPEILSLLFEKGVAPEYLEHVRYLSENNKDFSSFIDLKNITKINDDLLKFYIDEGIIIRGSWSDIERPPYGFSNKPGTILWNHCKANLIKYSELGVLFDENPPVFFDEKYPYPELLIGQGLYELLENLIKNGGLDSVKDLSFQWLVKGWSEQDRNEKLSKCHDLLTNYLKARILFKLSRGNKTKTEIEDFNNMLFFYGSYSSKAMEDALIVSVKPTPIFPQTQ